MAKTLQYLQQMLNNLANSSVRVKRMNLDRTMVMFNELLESVALYEASLEIVHKCVDLGLIL